MKVAPLPTGAAEQALYQDSLAEYVWALDVWTIAADFVSLVQPVLEICSYYDVTPWHLSSRQLDEHFALYDAYLEQRYAGEIHRRLGAVAQSPASAFIRPVHWGDFGLRIPPSARATKELFAVSRDALPQARKDPVAVHNYVMSKLMYISIVRAAELCPVQLGEVRWE